MSLPNRPFGSNLRHTSIGGGSQVTSSSGPSPMLVARINEKKAELENLRQLRDLSGGLAAQMQTLEEKLSTLSDGTEGLLISICSSFMQRYADNALCECAAVATVLSNWHSVMQAINMASRTYCLILRKLFVTRPLTKGIVQLTKSAEAGQAEKATNSADGTLLPQTLVRIPVEQDYDTPQSQ